MLADFLFLMGLKNRPSYPEIGQPIGIILGNRDSKEKVTHITTKREISKARANLVKYHWVVD